MTTYDVSPSFSAYRPLERIAMEYAKMALNRAKSDIFEILIINKETKEREVMIIGKGPKLSVYLGEDPDPFDFDVEKI